MKPHSLPPERRVRRRADFERAYTGGKKLVTREFALFARANGLQHSRLGITTTRKLGKAVVRNRARRLLREAFRTRRDHLPAGWDLVFVVRAPLLRRTAVEVGDIMVELAGDLPAPRHSS